MYAYFTPSAMYASSHSGSCHWPGMGLPVHDWLGSVSAGQVATEYTHNQLYVYILTSHSIYRYDDEIISYSGLQTGFGAGDPKSLGGGGGGQCNMEV